MLKTGQMILMTMVFILFLPLFVRAGAIDLPKTGQTTCYDSLGNVIACPGTGQDGEIQAGVSWPNPRFTDNGDQTVTDNLTGLMWTKNANTPGPSVCSPASTKTWQVSLDYIACLNSNNYLDYNDWRLPNIIEIESLIDAENNFPAFPISNPFIGIQYYYFSSTSRSNDVAWFIMSFTGGVSNTYKNTSSFSYVWPVRSIQSKSNIQLPKTGQTTTYGIDDDGSLQNGVPWPDPRFTDIGDGTVTDNLTGLVWTKDAAITMAGMTWQQAFGYVAGMNAGINPNFGYSDWRLPNRKELLSLIAYGNNSLTTHTYLPFGHPFINTAGNYRWSSTSSDRNPINAWVIDLTNAATYEMGKFNNYYYVWPVRSGQVDTTPPTGSIVINSNAVWTNKTAVTLTLDCTDFDSGCADMRFSNDNINFTDWEPFSTGRPWTLPSGDGEKWVYVQYRDGAGNWSEGFFDSINLDTTKPVVKGVSDSPDPFKPQLGEVSKISFTLLDNLSGTCRVQAKIYNSVNTLMRTIKKNGLSCPVAGAAGLLKWDGKDTNGVLVPADTYTYKIQARDNASNKSAIKQGTVGVE